MRGSRDPAAVLEGLAADIARDRRAFDARLDDLGLATGTNGQSILPVARAALIAVSIHGAHSAVEATLERVADTIDGSRPTGSRWHSDLLDRMGAPFGEHREAVLSAASLRAMRQLMSLRHFFRHSYAAELDIALLETNASTLLGGAEVLRQDLERLESFVRNLANRVGGSPRCTPGGVVQNVSGTRAGRFSRIRVEN